MSCLVNAFPVLRAKVNKLLTQQFYPSHLLFIYQSNTGSPSSVTNTR